MKAHGQNNPLLNAKNAVSDSDIEDADAVESKRVSENPDEISPGIENPNILISSKIETPTGRKRLFDAILADYKENNLEVEEFKEIPVPNLVLNGNFTDAISLLRIQKDAKQNIKSHYAFHEGNKIFIRDAREQKPNQENTYHDWAIMGINYANAAIQLLEAHKIPVDLDSKFSSELNKITSDFLRDIEKSKDPEVDLGLFVNKKMIPHLMNHIKKIPEKQKKALKITKLDKNRVKKQLAEVRDFSNFEHQTMSVATKIKSGDVDVYQIDIPLTGGMSNELMLEYASLANRHKGIQGPLQPIVWYDKQKPHIQYLIRKHAQAILDGQIIPTQLRKYFPGIRNGGEEFLIDMNTKKTIQHHFHSGTPAHLLTKGSQEATDESIKQLKTLTGAQHVFVLTLLSPLYIGVGNDANLVGQVEKSVKKCNQGKTEATAEFHTSNIPLNWIRGLLTSNNQMSGANWLVDKARDEERALPSGHPNKAKLLGLIIEFGQLQSGSAWNFDPENRNLQLVSVIQQLGHAINEAHKIRFPDEKDFVAVVSSCQSGKDRAGLARIKTLVDSMKKYFSKQDPQLLEQTLINAGQVPAQAGFQGGTIGASGIKKDTKGASTTSWKKLSDALFKETASYNKAIPKDPRNAKKSRNKKIALAAIGLIVGGALCATGIGALAGAPLIAVSVAPLVAAVGVIAADAIMVAGIAVGAAALGKGIKDAVSARKADVLASRFEEKMKSDAPVGVQIKEKKNKSSSVSPQQSEIKSDASSVIHQANKKEEKQFTSTHHVVNHRTNNQPLRQNKTNQQAKIKVPIHEITEAREMLNKYNSDITYRDEFLQFCIPVLFEDKKLSDAFIEKIKKIPPVDQEELITLIKASHPKEQEKSPIKEIISELSRQLVEKQKSQSSTSPTSIENNVNNNKMTPQR